VEHRIVLANGVVKHLHERGEVQANDDGKAVKMFGTAQDITGRKRVEELLLKEKEEQKALIKKLEDAHNQLLQSEKLASIGQLAAGVAHEINNPIGYVNSNLGTLRTYVDQILSVLDAYEQAESACDPAARARAKALKEEVELDFLKQDILDLLKESGEGIQRVKQIVQDLKDFSHIDEAEWQLADLHHGLDSTLNVAHNEIKYKADVLKQYGDIPRVECLPSQINQVFMNLLVNAAHAMDESKRGLITVRTGVRGSEAWVEVVDNGKGIPPENLTRIFDPFFTTKPVGKGTGLGLSLAYGIVEKHNGRIEVESEVGKGTTFRLWLPIGGPGTVQ
jgi:signal transduction histidine kinase